MSNASMQLKLLNDETVSANFKMNTGRDWKGGVMLRRFNLNFDSFDGSSTKNKWLGSSRNIDDLTQNDTDG